jgi:hypothetical protein
MLRELGRDHPGRADGRIQKLCPHSGRTIIPPWSASRLGTNRLTPNDLVPSTKAVPNIQPATNFSPPHTKCLGPAYKAVPSHQGLLTASSKTVRASSARPRLRSMYIYDYMSTQLYHRLTPNDLVPHTQAATHHGRESILLTASSKTVRASSARPRLRSSIPSEWYRNATCFPIFLSLMPCHPTRNKATVITTSVHPTLEFGSSRVPGSPSDDKRSSFFGLLSPLLPSLGPVSQEPPLPPPPPPVPPSTTTQLTPPNSHLFCVFYPFQTAIFSVSFILSKQPSFSV